MTGNHKTSPYSLSRAEKWRHLSWIATLWAASLLLPYWSGRFGPQVDAIGFAALAAAAAVLASVGVAATVSGGVAFLLGKRVGPRGRILSLVLGFLTLIVSYGIIYYSRYTRDPTAFLFAGTSHERRSLEAISDSYVADQQYAQKLRLLLFLNRNPQAGVTAINSNGIPSWIDARHAVKYQLVHAPGGDTLTFSITEDGNTFVFPDYGALHPETQLIVSFVRCHKLDDFVPRLRALISYYTAQRTRLRARLEGGAMSAPWDLADFLYFSAVTMTTVGYGDIVPGNRTARMLVLGQAVLGVLYLGFALDFLRPDKSA